MPGTFDNGEVRFQYPENWPLDRQDSDEGWTISVQSPGTAFLLISSYTERPPVDEVLRTSLQAMQQDYPELEADEATEKLAGHASKGFDISFFSIDTVNSCTIRAFRTKEATYLILAQSSSFDTATNIAVLDAIRTSLQLV
ncbi:MAG: hypothetical protein U0796_17085 [Gemmatales bacterium]